MKKQREKIFRESKEEVSKKLRKILLQKINIPRLTSDFLNDTLQIV